MNKNEAILCAKLAKSAYGRPYKGDDFQLTAKFENPGSDTQGILGIANNRTFVVAFRGSEETGITDWITDAKFIQAEFPYSKTKNLMVHQGFLEAYQTVREAVISAVNDNPHKRVICTGHSLGAGLATLCALDIQNNVSGKMTYCYTFGSPKTGNTQFATAYNQNVKQTFRFVNGSDIVPSVPPGDYKHVGELCHVGTSDENSEFSLSAIINSITDKIEDHLPHSYIAAMEEWND